MKLKVVYLIFIVLVTCASIGGTIYEYTHCDGDLVRGVFWWKCVKGDR